MEKLDLYNKNGIKLNKTILRGERLNENEYIKLAVIYIKCKNYYLFQKCSTRKCGLYAVTGGHVSSGHSSKLQACIEVKEELGLEINENKLQFLGNIYRPNAIFDIYLFEDKNLKNYNFILQKDEVESVHWFTKAQIESLIKQNLVRESSQEHYNKFIK